MKTQLWLRPDQVELLRDSLTFTLDRLNEGLVVSEAHKMAGLFVYRRLNEILALLPAAQHEGADK